MLSDESNPPTSPSEASELALKYSSDGCQHFHCCTANCDCWLTWHTLFFLIVNFPFTNTRFEQQPGGMNIFGISTLWHPTEMCFERPLNHSSGFTQYVQIIPVWNLWNVFNLSIHQTCCKGFKRKPGEDAYVMWFQLDLMANSEWSQNNINNCLVLFTFSPECLKCLQHKLHVVDTLNRSPVAVATKGKNVRPLYSN